MKNLIERTVSGAIMLVFLGITIFLGDRALFIMGLFLSTVAFFELNQVLERFSMKASPGVTIPFGILALIALYFERVDLSMSLAPLLFVGHGVRCVLSDQRTPRNTMGSVFSFLYLFLNFGLLMVMPNQIYLYLVAICSWGCDTFAYIFGMLFGKHKLIPKVSPKKSVEGAIGGVFGSVVLMLILFSAIGEPRLLLFVPVVIVGAVLSQFGDLFASKMKRETHMKDFGHLFIGHGGVLDRFDSMLFVIPFIYMISLLLK